MTILLGLVDGEIDSKYTITWDTNKIGGKSNWMYTEQPHHLCGGCGQPLSLIVQLYCPLADSPYHRTLYVLSCLRGPQCWSGSQGWMVLRSQCLDTSHATCTSSNESKKPVTMVTDDWGCDMDDWGEPTHGDVATTASMASELDILKSSDTKTQNTNPCERGQTDEDWGEGDKSNNNVSMVTASADAERTVRCTSFPLNASQSEHYNSAANTCNQNSNVRDEDNNVLLEKSDINPINSEILDTESSSLLHLKQMNIDDNISDDFDNDKGAVSVGKTDSVVCDTDSYMPSEETVSNMMSLLANKHTEPSRRDNLCTFSAGDNRELKSYFISVIEEPVSVGKVADDGRHIEDLIHDYEHSQGINVKKLIHNTESVSSKGSGSEAYEKSHIPHKDAMFHKFYKKTAHYPQQCIRYEWQGLPLFITEPDSTALRTVAQSVCAHCGGPMVFELQLMPALVQHLKGQGCDLEFGTVLIFTCKGSCWSVDDKTREESVFVMTDPDQHLFRL